MKFLPVVQGFKKLEQEQERQTDTHTDRLTEGINMLHLWVINIYPAIRSIGRDTKFTVAFFTFYVQLQISQPGLYRSA